MHARPTLVKSTAAASTIIRAITPFLSSRCAFVELQRSCRNTPSTARSQTARFIEESRSLTDSLRKLAMSTSYSRSLTTIACYRTALGNILTPPEPVSSQPHTPPMPVANPAFGRPSYPSARPSQNGPAPHALQSPRAWDFKSAQPQSYPSPPWDDSFMSWEPLRQSSEWPQGGL